MEFGIGLPLTLADTSGETVLEWARRSDAHGFTTLGVIDRTVYPSYEPLTALAAAAAVTRRIRLMTTVLVAPVYETAMLAKQAATIDVLSGGRLSLGFGVGARDDEFIATGMPFHRRGKRLDQQLQELRTIWSGGDIHGVGPIGPTPAQPGGPPLFVGGYTERMAQRVVRWADGFIAGSGGPQRAEAGYKLAAEAWQAEGRPGKPRFIAATYFAIGESAAEDLRTNIFAYYGPRATGIVDQSPTTEQGVLDVVLQYREIGAEELILWPGSNDLDQIERLAAVVLS